MPFIKIYFPVLQVNFIPQIQLFIFNKTGKHVYFYSNTISKNIVTYINFNIYNKIDGDDSFYDIFLNSI